MRQKKVGLKYKKKMAFLTLLLQEIYAMGRVRSLPGKLRRWCEAGLEVRRGEKIPKCLNLRMHLLFCLQEWDGSSWVLLFDGTTLKRPLRRQCLSSSEQRREEDCANWYFFLLFLMLKRFMTSRKVSKPENCCKNSPQTEQSEDAYSTTKYMEAKLKPRKDPRTEVSKHNHCSQIETSYRSPPQTKKEGATSFFLRLIKFIVF